MKSASDLASGSDLASLAALLADETRATICIALLDGRAWTAGELAAHTHVVRSTATEHLHRLVDGGLLVERRQGRHRYVQLADASVAHLIEDLSARFEPGQDSVRGLRAVTADAALRHGRTCYDHLAGTAGAKLCEKFFDNGWVARIGSGRAVRLTPVGKAALQDLLGLSGVD